MNHCLDWGISGLIFRIIIALTNTYLLTVRDIFKWMYYICFDMKLVALWNGILSRYVVFNKIQYCTFLLCVCYSLKICQRSLCILSISEICIVRWSTQLGCKKIGLNFGDAILIVECFGTNVGITVGISLRFRFY